MLFDSPKVGDSVLILSGQHGPVVHVARIWDFSAKRINVNGGGAYLRSNGKEFGGSRFAKPASADDVARFEAEQQARRDEREREDDRKRQEAYDALPEIVKLYRKLSWLFDCNGEAKFATAPVEYMRAIVEWAEANGLETN